jgi:16S rRNA processing protein RimM
VRVTPKGVIARVSGVADRNAAEALKGARLFTERSQLPAAADDEFYHVDLIGLTAVSPAGEPVGEIVAVHNYGAGDLLEIRLAESRKTELLPFSAAYVPDVDIPAGKLVVAMPEQTDDED